MERIDGEIKGDKFQCKCGNTEFEQDCFVKSTEIINVVQISEETMFIVSKSMKDIEEEGIEYTSEFSCPKCNSIYEITKRDGKDIIVNTGDE